MKAGYILANDPAGEYTELRYSLRSLEKHLNGLTGVVICGAKPSWLSDEAVHLPHTQLGSKGFDQLDKVKMLSRHIRPESWLYMNDDFFLTKDFDADSFPLFHQQRTLLERSIEREDEVKGIQDAHLKQRMSVYSTELKRTGEYLNRLGFPDNCYELHQPMPIRQPQLFFFCCSYLSREKEFHNPKSVYANMVNDNNRQVSRNGKMTQFNAAKMKAIESIGYFSTNSKWLASGGLKYLEKHYPNKSKFEL
jgi:hypothetical protein